MTSRADYLAVALPTLGWLNGRRRLVTRGSGQEVNEHLARRPRLEAAAMATLRYFDTVNVADRIACPTLMGRGGRAGRPGVHRPVAPGAERQGTLSPARQYSS